MNLTLRIEALRCEYLADPLGIDVIEPRLSWTLASDQRGVKQVAYQVLVASSAATLAADQGDLWDSGRVPSDETAHVLYAGAPLASRQRAFWKVRVWDTADERSSWSEPAQWEMGLLDPEAWQATWITPAIEEDTTKAEPSPMLRKAFTLDGEITRARLYATAHGTYEVNLNGRHVGESYFTPGWTSYQTRLQYQVYDVTEFVQAGDNAIGAMLGDGWYRGYYFIQYERNFYGDRLALLLQLEVEYADGRVERLTSDESWRAATGPIRYADHYMGEFYDARLARDGWTSAGYDDSDWSGVLIESDAEHLLVAECSPRVRKIEEIRPVEILTTPEGTTVVDFGQNMVGFVRLRVEGPAGATVVLRHTEVLDKAGNFYVDHLRSAEQKVTYVLKGKGPEEYEPHFSFQGFRYVEVIGYPGDLTLDSLTGVVLHSAMEPTGTFTCSNPLINQLQHNIVWGQKGNFLDVPTDCPQRDERLGWTGDAQVFIGTASFNMDVAAFFTKWLKDVVAEQSEAGAYPFYAPYITKDPVIGAAAWGDAGIICPWTLYLNYGDTRILTDHYESMAGWIRYMQGVAGEGLIWRDGFQFGDWLATDRPDLGTPFGLTDKDLIGTAFFAYSAQLMAKIAAVLGKTDDTRIYEDLAERVARAFCAEFVTPNGRVGANTQTAYVLALMFDLLPEVLREPAVRRLVADVEARDMHLATGFVGTAYIAHVLSRFGHLDTAYDLLLQDTCPSWLYAVTQGATTIWERWDGQRPDGTFQTPDMNSFNHYAYGAIGEWLYKVVAGLQIDPQRPAYKHTLIHPQPGGGLTSARAAYKSIHGEIVSDWQLEEPRMQLNVTIPANTTATVVLPAKTHERVTESGRLLGEAEGVVSWAVDEDELRVEIGSGRYVFSVALDTVGIELKASTPEG